MRRNTMQNALIAPKTAPVARPTTIAREDAETALQGRDLQQVADGHRREYMFEPTERSMPPVSSTKVMPTAMTPTNDACLTMLQRRSRC